jgi:dihydroorotate dehydrogenase
MLLKQRIESFAELSGGELALPAGPSAGALNEASAEMIIDAAVDILRNTPAPYLTLGSGTTPVSVGNAVKFQDEENGKLARVFYFDEGTGEAVNSIGLKNPGREAYLAVVRGVSKVAEDLGKTVIMSVSTIGDEDPSIVLPGLAYDVLEAGAHGVEVNLGCPNKVELSGQRHAITGRDAEATEIVLSSVERELGQSVIWGPKLSYYFKEVDNDALDYHDLIGICRVVNKFSPDFVSLTNTEPNVVMYYPDGSYVLDRIPGNAGGGSGPARADEAYDQLCVARRELPSSVDIISSTGVYDGSEVLRRERAGALLSGVVSRLFHGTEKGFTFAQSIRQVYNEYLAARAIEAEL